MSNTRSESDWQRFKFEEGKQSLRSKKMPWFKTSDGVTLGSSLHPVDHDNKHSRMPFPVAVSVSKFARRYQAPWNKTGPDTGFHASVAFDEKAKLRLKGRMSWDPSLLADSTTLLSAPEDYNVKSGSVLPLTADQQKVKVLLQRHQASTAQATDQTERLPFMEKRYTFYPLPVGEEYEEVDDVSDMETSVSNRRRRGSLQPDSDSDSDDDGLLSRDQRDKFFGDVARKNFFTMNKVLSSKVFHFHPNRRHTSTSEPEEASTSLEEYKATSPRQQYISGCAQANLAPLPIVIRKRATTVFDFAYQGLGDAFIVQFSEALRDMPFVEEINVRDNRLTDIGLNALLQAIQHKPNLLKLDISMNEVGEETSVTIREYLVSSICTIQYLVMEKSDIDDHEAAAFMSAFEKNNTVTELNLSRNRIGELEVLNFVQPDFITGGEAISAMLNVNLNLVKLNLSWNLLRLESASTLAESLLLNYNLLELNLSYNACGDHGAMAFGTSLQTNKSLRMLDLSYNNIGTKGAMVLAESVGKNAALRLLKMNGNSIGKEGGKVFMFAMSSKGGESGCDIEMTGCNLGSSKKGAFNAKEPTGAYTLNMANPYDKMVAYELLRLATYKEGCSFSKLSHKNEGSLKPRVIELRKPLRKDITTANVMFSDIDRDHSGSIDTDELIEVLKNLGMRPKTGLIQDLLVEYDADGSGSIDKFEFEGFFFHAVFATIDTDESGSLDAEELQEALKILGLTPTASEVKAIINMYDIDGSGSIEKDEFADFMKTRSKEEARKKQMDLNTQDRELLDDGSIWQVPTDGILEVVFVSERVASSVHTVNDVVDDDGVNNLIRNINIRAADHSEREALLNCAINDSDMNFTADQAVDLLTNCDLPKSRRAMSAAAILPQLANVNETHKFMSTFLSSKERTSVQYFLGAMFGPLTGNATRFYSLDLKKEMDRSAAMKLCELARTEKEFSKKRSGRSDTSQNGNWENFRNATLNTQAIVLTTTYFNSLPISGILEFDYVSTTRPTRGAKPISTRRFDQLMIVLKSSNEEDILREVTPSKWKTALVSVKSTRNISAALLAASFKFRLTKGNVDKKLSEIEAAVGNRWLSSAQASEIIHSMPTAFDARIETARLLFSRIIDIENYVDIYDSLPFSEQMKLNKMIGILNMINPMKPDRFYELELSSKEDRDMCKILVKLAVEEPGENWLNESYTWVKGEPPIAGWELPATWAKDDCGEEGGPRRTGHLTLEYYSGADQGCAPIWSLRKELRSTVLCGTRLYL